VPLLYVLLVLFWGATFLWVEIAVDGASPLTIVSVRTAVGGIVVAGAIALAGPTVRERHRPAALRPWLVPGIVLAIVAALIPGALIALAQQEIESGTASIFIATAPIWAALLTWITIGGSASYLSRFQIGGLMVGVLGVALLVGRAPTAAQLWNELLVVFIAFVMASGAVYAQRSFVGAPPFTAAIATCVLAGLIAVPLGIAGWIASPPGLGEIGAMVALGATSSGLAYMIYFELIREIGATRTITVTYLQPLVAIVLGALLLGERLGPLSFIGLALILLGVGLVNGQLGSSARRAPDPGPTADSGRP
jgi:drug/metabolite transporter (DMT)-like permease